MFDALRTLPPDEREAWLTALPPADQMYLPRVREMLLYLDRIDEQPQLLTLPRLDAPVADLAHKGDLVGPYRLLRPLGRGGMSVVWLAERCDEGMKRHVAIKLPLLTLNTQQQLERFVRERDVLAALEHPHIARLYDAGVSPAGQPYLVLEHVHGLTLTRYCDEHGLGVAARLRLFLQVLSAVEYAHGHLVVHRDIKPSNILIDAHGQVKLLDFGVAKLLPDPGTADGRAPTTQYGAWALTPLYAAPEQLKGQSITTSADVYALGVLLFELLTGEWPYVCHAPQNRHDQRSMAELMHAVLHDEPTRPSAAAMQEEAVRQRGHASVNNLRAELHGDLSVIVLKALHKLPEQRYRSAERFADDVQRFLTHKPIAARPPSWTYRVRLFARRHRGASLGVAIGAVVALVFGSLAWQQHQHSVEYRERALTIRNFMFDLINDAEPNENQSDAPVTAKQLVDGAVERARRTYSDKPRLKGELLSELGYMYGRLGEPAAAKALRGEALALLESHAPNTDPALNKARAHLAITWVLQNDTDSQERGRALAQAAMDQCSGVDEECAKVRFFALDALAMADGRLGYFGKSLIDRRQALREAKLGFGAGHVETVQAAINVAVAARNAGQYQEARPVLDELLASTSNRTLPAGLRTSISILKTRLDIDLGQYASAHRSLLDLIKADPSANGPSIPVGWSFHARQQLVVKVVFLSEALLALGDPAAAKQAADRALALIGSGYAEWESREVRKSLAQAMGLLGNPASALDEVQLLLDEQPAPSNDSISALSVRLVRGELLARAGRLSDARIELEAASDQASLAPPNVHPVLLAQALDQLGSVLRQLGRPDQALVRHEQARNLLREVMPDDHPLQVRNALYSEAARAEAAEHVGRERMLQQAEYYKGMFPAESVWRKIVDRYLDASCSRTRREPGCLMLL